MARAVLLSCKTDDNFSKLFKLNLLFQSLDLLLLSTSCLVHKNIGYCVLLICNAIFTLQTGSGLLPSTNPNRKRKSWPWVDRSKQPKNPFSGMSRPISRLLRDFVNYLWRPGFFPFRPNLFPSVPNFSEGALIYRFLFGGDLSRFVVRGGANNLCWLESATTPRKKAHC